jgi:signal transduction histidine kinase
MTTLDLPSPATSTFPGHWRTAALPAAAFYQARSDALISLATATAVELSAPLQAALKTVAMAGGTLIALDKNAAYWRLRRLPGWPADLWLVQSLAESRRLLLQNFRAVLASRLASSLLHELRNPLNALGLQSDLLTRMLKPAATPEAVAQAAGRVSQMKERLRDLLDRQNSMAGLWLSEPADAPPLDLPLLLDETLRLLRSYGSQREVRMQAQDLPALGSGTLRLDSMTFRIVLLAIGVLAVDSAATSSIGGDKAVLMQFSAADVHQQRAATLIVRADWRADALPGALHISKLDEWLATLALLLDDQPVQLSQPHATGIRLTFIESV